MSQVIEQFKAERDRELQEIDDQYAPRLDKLLLEAKEAKGTWDKAAQNINKQRRLPTDEEEGIKIAWENASLRYNALIFEWKFAQEAVRRKTKSRIVAFYQNHSEEIRDILDLVKEEIPMLIFTASLKVNNGHPHKEQNRRNKEKGIVKGYSENKTNNSEDRQLVYDVTFSDDSLRRYLNSSLKSYIDLLKNVSPESYKEANNYIEECIADKGHIVIRQRELFGASQLKADITMPTVLNANTQRAKEAVFGVTKVEGAAFEPSKNDFLYNDLIPVNIDVGVLKKRTVSTVVSIDFNKMKAMGVTIGSEQRLTHYDREIHNAISTLCVTGNKYITPQMIYQVLSGNKKDAKMTSKAREEILASIDKMMFTEIEIDATAEVTAGWNKKAKYKGPLIPSERVEVIKLNGQEVIDCVHLFRNPPLYDYANNKSQIDRVDIKMLNAPVNNTPENIELKGYLLRRITSIKNPNSKLSPVIRYDALYEYLGVTASNETALKKKRKEIRDRVKEILNFWICEAFIKGYKEEKEGKSIAKLKIEI